MTVNRNQMWRNKRVRVIPQRNDPFAGQVGTVTRLSGDDGYETNEYAVWVVWDHAGLSPCWMFVWQLVMQSS